MSGLGRRGPVYGRRFRGESGGEGGCRARLNLELLSRAAGEPLLLPLPVFTTYGVVY